MNQFVTSRILCGLLLSAAPIAQAANNPVPFLDETVSPSAVAPGHAAFTLKLTGGGFVSGSLVNWNGAPLSTVAINHHEIDAAVPATLVATPQTASVKIVNPAPGGGSSNTVFVEISARTAYVVMPNYDTTLPNLAFTAQVVTGDFNHDGKADVALANATCCSVSVLLGNGDGTFQPAVEYAGPANEFLSAITTGDFNGDGIPDLAVGNTFGLFQGSVFILFGNGDGTFHSSGATYPLADYTSTLSAADLNGDGKLDLVAGYFSDGSVISVLLGNGDGTFRARTDYATGKNPAALVLADFNNDGIVDIATSNTGDGTTSLLLGNGDGTFKMATTMQLILVEGIAAGDFNHDGNVDLAIQDGFSVGVFLGNGDGTFQTPHFGGSVSNSNPNLIVGDFNGDGNLDLALPQSTGDIEVIPGNGDGTFQPGIVIPVNVPQSIPLPLSLATADFNNDGLLDIVSANNSVGFSTFLQSTLLVSKAAIGFGTVTFGTTKGPSEIKLTNFGAATLNLGTITVTGTSPTAFPITTTCGATLGSHMSCTIGVSFTPNAVGNSFDILNILNSTLGLSQTVTLTGDSTGFSLTPSSLNFGTVTVGQTSPAQIVTLNNASTVTLKVSAITLAPNLDPDFNQTNSCPTSLTPGATCNLSVTFAPQAIGALTGSLLIHGDIGLGPQGVPLTGTGQ
jgi:hypothetical protein